MMTGAYRHGRHRHCGYIDSAGWVKVSDSAWLFYVEESWILRAADYSARSRKPRFEVSADRGYIRCVQGHSADAWRGEVDLDRLYGRVEDARKGLSDKSLCGAQPGLRSGSTALVTLVSRFGERDFDVVSCPRVHGDFRLGLMMEPTAVKT